MTRTSGSTGRTTAIVLATAALGAMPLLAPGASVASDANRPETVAVGPAAGHSHAQIPSHFVGLSIEWSLIERYMGAGARPAFSNLLSNLDSGVLRIGGSSQDAMKFDQSAANTNQVITPEDLTDIRATLDQTYANHRTGWKTVLGTAMSPVTTTRPFVSPEHTRNFIDNGVEPAFDGASLEVAGVELGNEPDLTYHGDLDAYLADFARWKAAGAASPYTAITPASSEQITTWRNVKASAPPAPEVIDTRFFWNWPAILDATAPTASADAGPLGAWAADHFYPLARTCASDPYRCPTIPALLGKDRSENLAYNAYVHAREADKHGLGYRLEEINTAAGRGAHGVSDVAASAVWALDTMFNVACPQPPDEPGANTNCRTGGVGVNFHNAEVNAFFKPEEGNAYYNAIDYDATAAMGSPTPAPEYYAMLLFSKFAQGATDLQPLPVADTDSVTAWSVVGNRLEQRDFVINRSDHPVTVTLHEQGTSFLFDRMSPLDPDGAGKTLDATQVSIDGRQVAADGSWPGFRPEHGSIRHGTVTVQLGVGEAGVVRVGLH